MSAASWPIACAAAVAACSAVDTAAQRSEVTQHRATFMHAGFGAGPVLFTDGGGRLLEERRHEPFGVLLDVTDLRARDLDPLNKRRDAASGWVDHAARWLAPETARWLTPDPPVEGPTDRQMSAPWSLHPYQFVDQNPIAYWDPDGRDPAPLVADKPHRDAALARRAEALTGKLYWAGPSGPDPKQHYQIDLVTERADDTGQHREINFNDFAWWARGWGPDPGDSAKMNCWEMVILAGYQAGVAPKSWVTSTYAIAALAGDLTNNPQLYSNVLKTALGIPSAKEWHTGEAVPAGNLVFFGPRGTTHVAVSTGRTVDGKQEVMSLWIVPQNPDGTRNSKVQRTTIEDLHQMVNTNVIRTGPSPW